MVLRKYKVPKICNIRSCIHYTIYNVFEPKISIYKCLQSNSKSCNSLQLKKYISTALRTALYVVFEIK